MKNILNKFKSIVQEAKIKENIKIVIPNNKVEWAIFGFLYISYAILGIALIIKTDLLYNPDGVGAGSYLGYDNFNHSITSGGFLDISHPFFGVFHFTKFIITTVLSFIFGEKALIVFCVSLMNFIVSLSLVILYKYLKNIINLSIYRSILLTLFCGSFFTVIVLSFTTETYPFSFLILLFSIYLLSNEHNENGKFNTSSVAILSIVSGAITITNFAKPLTAILLNKESLKIKLIKVLKITAIFFSLILGIYIIYYFKSEVTNDKSNYSILHVIENNIFQYLTFSAQWVKETFMDFWSSSILVANLKLQTVRVETVLRPSEYQYLIHYLFSFSLLFIFITGLFINRKNILVKLLTSYLFIDFIIHIVFRYGMDEAIIFGGHWLFIVPIVIGWLYTNIENIKKGQVVLDIYIWLFILIMLNNNISEIIKFFLK